MKIALAQINQTVGNVTQNKEKIISTISKLQNEDIDLVVFPEFSVCGGYCSDLFVNSDFINENINALNEIAQISTINCLIGNIYKLNDKLVNGVSLINKNIELVSIKQTLNDSNYFNDKKYFSNEKINKIFEIKNKKVCCVIADSIKSIEQNLKDLSKESLDMVIVCSCSVYYENKNAEIESLLKELSVKYKIDICYVNMVGAQDGYVFDGGSCYVDKEGNFKSFAKKFKEDIAVFDTENNIKLENVSNNNKDIYDALVLGLQDYCLKNKFKKVALGVSGGIDSALTLAIAVDALGKDNVLGVLMPSQYTSKESMDYSYDICNRLNVKTKTISIQEIYDNMVSILQPSFDNKPKDLTEENLQARIRGNILMALSNKFGYLVLCTCNKSEDAVGYSTLYGDAVGGYSVIGDLLKKQVYELSNYRNTISDVIPQGIITRPPTAELRQNQKDSDSLPEYDILDDILEKMLYKNLTYKQIIETGIKKEVLDKVIKLLFVSEYKRRQTPIGTKISKKSFIRDINLPMTNGFIWKQ